MSNEQPVLQQHNFDGGLCPACNQTSDFHEHASIAIAKLDTRQHELEVRGIRRNLSKVVGTITITPADITYTGEFFDKLRKPVITDERLREVAEIVSLLYKASEYVTGDKVTGKEPYITVLRKLIGEAR